VSTRPDLTFTRYTGPHAVSVRHIAEEIYRDSYSPESQSDAFNAGDRWMTRFDAYAAIPGFDLVIARLPDGEPVGQAWGWPLAPDARWWEGLETKPEPGFTDEDGHRTFALSEIMVRRHWTGQGIAHALHDELLSARRERRATLLVRPANHRAYAAYASWGWQTVSRLTPGWPDAPVFDVLILPLPASTGVA
jgi:GNAT superfamily N-acetyltransferase